MRLIGWLLLILLGLGWLASELPLAETHPPEKAASGWRRTSDGWEDSSGWTRPATISQPALHPAVVGLLELFLATAALLAFSGKSNQPPARHGATRR